MNFKLKDFQDRLINNVYVCCQIFVIDFLVDMSDHANKQVSLAVSTLFAVVRSPFSLMPVFSLQFQSVHPFNLLKSDNNLSSE